MSGRSSHSRTVGTTKKRHSFPAENLHPYKHQEKKQQNTNKRQSWASSIYEELDEAQALPLEQFDSPSMGHAVSNLSHKTATTCSKCNALLQGLNSPIGSYIEGEIFQQASRQMQYRNTFSHEDDSTQFHSQKQVPQSSKNYPTKSSGNFCECCHAQENELRNTRHACGQFPLSSKSRTSKRATRDSPDYVPFHAHEKGTREPQNPVSSCAQCFNMDGHLRNSLFRDMRNYYGTLQWQHHSKNIGEHYAYKDGIPYAPFAKEPDVREHSSETRCSQCRNLRDSLFANHNRNLDDQKAWNPYSLKDGNFLQPICWNYDPRGFADQCEHGRRFNCCHHR